MSSTRYDLIAYEVARQGYTNITLGVVDVEKAKSGTSETNQTFYLEMGKLGMERVVPGQVFAVGPATFGSRIVNDIRRGHDFDPNYTTGADGLMGEVAQRLERFGLDGLVIVDSNRMQAAVLAQRGGDPASYQDLQQEIASATIHKDAYRPDGQAVARSASVLAR